MKLRDYQTDLITKISDTLNKNKKCLVTVPTGGGKTVIFCNLAKKLQVRTLIICHTVEIKNQILKIVHILNISDLVDVGTIQSIIRKKILSPYELLIIDECHHACASSYRKVIKQYSDSLLLGVTATPFRTDNKSLIKIFGTALISLSVFELIEMGYLCDIVGYSFKTDVALPTPSGKDFGSKQLTAIINVKNRNELIVKSYIDKFPNSVPTVCFCSSLEHAFTLNKVFKEHGIKSDVIHGSLHKSVRERILDDLKFRNIDVILNYNILTEGFDEPIIQCLIMARPTASKSLYIQMIGRGIRTHESKQFCTVLEFTDSNYDVCDLRDLFNFQKSGIVLEQGEKLSKLNKNLKDEIPLGKGIVKEKVKMYSDPRLRLCTEGQKSILKSIGYKVEKNLTYIQAEIIILKHYKA